MGGQSREAWPSSDAAVMAANAPWGVSGNSGNRVLWWVGALFSLFFETKISAFLRVILVFVSFSVMLLIFFSTTVGLTTRPS